MDPYPRLVSRIVCLCVFRRSESSRLSSSQLVLFVSSIQPVRFYEPSDPLASAASRLNISASGRWPTAYTFPILELLFTFCRSITCRFRPSCVVRFMLLSAFHVPCRSCRSLPCLFPVRPMSFISALDVYQSYRCFLVWPCPFSP
jgi:hypothetical protein